jgi:hypothetical protein
MMRRFSFVLSAATALVASATLMSGPAQVAAEKPPEAVAVTYF